VPELQQIDQQSGGAVPPYRVDVQVHELLTNSKAKPSASLRSPSVSKRLPEPAFPQRPELLNKEIEVPERVPGEPPYRRRWIPPLILDTMRGWLFSLYQVAAAARRLSSAHRVSFYRMEVQSGLPLLLGF
jgi:hypothetical protein